MTGDQADVPAPVDSSTDVPYWERHHPRNPEVWERIRDLLIEALDAPDGDAS